jgi:hypothetical protein
MRQTPPKVSPASRTRARALTGVRAHTDRRARKHTPMQTRARGRTHPSALQTPRNGAYRRVLCKFCGGTVQVLWGYCESTVRVLCEHCASTVQVLCEYCASTVGVLRGYCGGTVRVPCEYCASTVRYCAVLWVLSGYCASTVRVPRITAASHPRSRRVPRSGCVRCMLPVTCVPCSLASRCMAARGAWAFRISAVLAVLAPFLILHACTLHGAWRVVCAGTTTLRMVRAHAEPWLAAGRRAHGDVHPPPRLWVAWGCLVW